MTCRKLDFKTLLSIACAVYLVVIGLRFFSAPQQVFAAEPIKVAMTPDHWNTMGSAEFVKHNGFDSLDLKPGQNIPAASVKGLSFRNGTIEFDVASPWSMGTGIAFRLDKEGFEHFEYLYLRPQPKCGEAFDCIQYTPQTHWTMLWDLFPQFQGPAPLHEDEWNHVKMVISGQRMNVYVNGAKSPTLKVGRLESENLEGGILLAGPGFFANLIVTPDAVEGLPSEAEKDPTANDNRYIRKWQLSPFYTLPAAKAPSATDLPELTAAWATLDAERNGLMNLSRKYGVPLQGKGPDRPVAWLRTNLTSDKNQAKKVAVGWNREVWVFVNGKLVYADKNLYQPPEARKKPDGRCSLDNGSFQLPLNAGLNEIDVALASNFYGWGLIMRLDDVEGVHLASK